jgi:hypothetical protein
MQMLLDGEVSDDDDRTDNSDSFFDPPIQNYGNLSKTRNLVSQYSA